MIGDSWSGVPLKIDQRVPVRAFLGVVAAAAPLLLGRRLELAFLISVHDSALL